MPKKLIKTDLSFDELLEQAAKTPPLKKQKGLKKDQSEEFPLEIKVTIKKK